MVDGRRLATLLLAALLVTGLSACGDDGDGDGGTALDDIGAGGDGDSDDGSDGGGDAGEDIDVGDIPGLSEGCEVFVEAAAAFGAAFSGSGDDIGSIADGLEGFADDAPDEIRDDLEVLADAYREFADALGDVDLSDPNSFSDPEVQAAVEEASSAFDSEEVSEASANVNAFAEANCGVGG